MSAGTVFNFGKHRGKTFQEVVEKNRGYAQWCLEQKNLRSQLRDFAAYVRKSGIDVSASQAVSQASHYSQLDAVEKVPQSQADGGLLGLAAAPSCDDATQPHSSWHSIKPQAGSSVVQNERISAAADASCGQKSGEAGGIHSGLGTTSSDAAQPNSIQSMGISRPPNNDCIRPQGESMFTTGPLACSHATVAPATNPACKAEPSKEPEPPFPQMGAQMMATTGIQLAAPQPAQAETSLPTQAEPLDAQSWSTGDSGLDAFLRDAVDPANLTKLASVSAIRRTAVAKLLQARIASVKNPPAYITKVIETAVQGEPEQRQSQDTAATQPLAACTNDSSQPRDPMTPQRLPSGTMMSPDQAVAQQQHWRQQQQQLQSQQGQPLTSQVPSWVTPELVVASQQIPSQQSAMFQPVAAPAQQQGVWAMTSQADAAQAGTQMTVPPSMPMQPGTWACMPTQQMVSGDALQATPQPAVQLVCMQSQGGGAPGMMVTQMQGPASQQPGVQWQMTTPWGPRGPCPATMTPEPVPQLTPWQRVLNHLESKGIPFSTVSNCHIDTRRDILKEVFGCREPLLRAQAEMDWMKNKNNAHGTAPRSCADRSRSRDGLMQTVSGGRPAGVSYIMQR